VTTDHARVRRLAPNRVSITLDAHEQRIIGAMLGELRALEGSADPVAVRLRPPAFPDDPAAEADYRSLVGAELDAGRRSRIATVQATLGAAELDDAQAGAWAGAINDIRLVLGTALEAGESADDLEIDPEDPEAGRRLVYLYLGWLLEGFIEVLADALPETPEPS
jgi:hypothetical protein